MAKKIEDNREMTFSHRLGRMANEDVFSDGLAQLLYTFEHGGDELLFTSEQRLQQITSSRTVKNKRLN
jgi:hypothetical protein